MIFQKFSLTHFNADNKQTKSLFLANKSLVYFITKTKLIANWFGNKIQYNKNEKRKIFGL